MKGIAAAIALLLCLAAPAGAQTSSIGLRGGYLSVSNTTAIPVRFGADDCGSFSNGISPGMYASIFGDFALLGDVLEIGGGVTYAKRPALLKATTQDGFEVLDPLDNVYKPLVQDHIFDSPLGYVSVELGLRSRPVSWLPVYFRASFDAGNAVASSTYSQTEEIVSPESVLYPENVRRRLTASGEFEGLSTSMGVTGAIGAVFNLSDNVEVGPEVFYRHGIGSLSTAASWEQSIVGVGFQFRYRIHDEPEPVVEEPPPPAPAPAPIVESLPEPPPVVIASISSLPLEIRETVVTQTFPLLPYVFFDSASAALKATYVSSSPTDGFDEKQLPRETLAIYYRILDVLGSRLQRNKQATLDLTGTSDGAEGGTAEERSGIARRRAESIATYLQTRWGIAAERLRVKITERPTIASNELYAEGAEENRRVELSSSDLRLLDPIVHTRFNEYVPVRGQHVFTTDVTNPERADGWNLDVLHRSMTLAQRNGPLMPPSKIVFDLTQEMTDRLGPIMGIADTLRARLNVRQPRYDDATGLTSFAVVKTVSNFEVSRLSLIVFDYDRADISLQNQEMMRRVVTASTGPGSTATIVGSTDRLGEFDHNMQLSVDRAKSVQNFVRSIAPSLVIDEVKGVGPNPSLFDNALPEGRFYCRTVTLQITTPLRDR